MTSLLCACADAPPAVGRWAPGQGPTGRQMHSSIPCLMARSRSRRRCSCGVPMRWIGLSPPRCVWGVCSQTSGSATIRATSWCRSTLSSAQRVAAALGIGVPPVVRAVVLLAQHTIRQRPRAGSQPRAARRRCPGGAADGASGSARLGPRGGALAAGAPASRGTLRMVFFALLRAAQGTPVCAAIGFVSVWRLVRRRRQTATPPLPGCQASASSWAGAA